MKRLMTITMLLLTVIACKKPGCTDPIAINYYPDATKDDGTCEYEDFNPAKLSGQILQNKILSKDTVWILDGRVTVMEGVTLSIEPGTIIKAVPGTGSSASTLIVKRGGKINAIGTPDEPIIFTSNQDNLDGNLHEGVRGLWGGVIINGKAPASFVGNVTEYQIEGIPATDLAGLMGGTDPHDNSGIFRYVSIRHGGSEIGEGNEINGLTLGAVGDCTQVDHIEIVGNTDDGIEIFGGTVNPHHILVWAQGDDGIDLDCGYAGRLSNSVVILTEASDHAIEIDGPEGAMMAEFELDSIYLVGATTNCLPDGVDGEIADYRKGARGISKNIWCIDFALSSDVELDNNADSQNYTNGVLEFENWYIKNPIDDSGNECFGITIDNLFYDKGTVQSTFEQDAYNFASFVTTTPFEYIINNEFSWTYYNYAH
jgi:hypothetical protein